MEPLGGTLSAGWPIAVYANGMTHVFALATNGLMQLWRSFDGVTWTTPASLPFPNLPACYPAAISLANGFVHSGTQSGLYLAATAKFRTEQTH